MMINLDPKDDPIHTLFCEELSSSRFRLFWEQQVVVSLWKSGQFCKKLGFILMTVIFFLILWV